MIHIVNIFTQIVIRFWSFLIFTKIIYTTLNLLSLSVIFTNFCNCYPIPLFFKNNEAISSHFPLPSPSNYQDTTVRVELPVWTFHINRAWQCKPMTSDLIYSLFKHLFLFQFLSCISLYRYTRFLSTCHLIDIWVVSSLELL